MAVSRQARKVEQFIQEMPYTSGRWVGEPFNLIGWQRDLIRKIFGTIRPDGLRQYRKVYLEIPKKNGKTEFAAAIANYMAFADDEPTPEVYFVSGDKEQASIAFNAADYMIQNTGLKNLSKTTKSIKRIDIPQRNGVLRVMSAEAKLKHGYRPSAIIADEVHIWPVRELWDNLVKGFSIREQPLVLAITTAGDDRNGLCWELHDYAVKVRDGVINDPTFLPLIYAADDADEWTDERVWAKANPSLGHTFGVDYLRSECEEAKNSPSRELSFRRLYLNQWIFQKAARYLSDTAWQACDRTPIDDAELADRMCFGGLDMSSNTDLTAFVLLFPPQGDDDRWIIRARHWIPEGNLAHRVRKDHAPYDVWLKLRQLEATAGTAIDDRVIIDEVISDAQRFSIREIGFDRWGAQHVFNRLTEAGINMVALGQGYQTMNAPTKELMTLVLGQKLRHQGNRPLEWMAGNLCVQTDPAGNVKPDKARSTEKIDGMVALIMAIDRAMRHGALGTVSAFEADDYEVRVL